MQVKTLNSEKGSNIILKNNVQIRLDFFQLRKKWTIRNIEIWNQIIYLVDQLLSGGVNALATEKHGFKKINKF